MAPHTGSDRGCADGGNGQVAKEDVRKALDKGWFAEQLGDRSLDQITPVSRLVELPPDHPIFRQGELISTVYVIVEGMVSIEIDLAGVRRQVVTLGEGELLGWSPVLQQRPLTASARTLGPARVVEIDVERLLQLFHSDKRLRYEFFRAMARALAKRLEATYLQLVDIYGLAP